MIRTSGDRSNVQIRDNNVIEPFVPGDFATVVYVDLAPRGNDVLMVRSSTIGEVKVAPSVLGAGADLTITLVDQDLDLNTNVPDAAAVVATTTKVGEGSEKISLIETSVTSGIFTGILKTRRSSLLGPQNDGEMNLIDGDEIAVTYHDAAPQDPNIRVCRDDSQEIYKREQCSVGSVACGCYNPRQDKATVAVFGRVFLDPGSTVTDSLEAGFSIHADSVLRVGPSMTVTVIDSDLNNDPTTTEIYSQQQTGVGGSAVAWVKIESLTNTQELPLELSETAVSSSIFTGVFVADDNAAAAAGRIVVGQGPAASSLVSVEYQDPTSGIRSSTARLQTNGEMSMSSEGSSSQVRVGDSVTVTVSDGDRNIDFDHPDSVIVKMKTHTEHSDAMSENLTLVETNSSSGVFTGSMRTTLGPSRIDNMLNCQQPQDKPCACSELASCSECGENDICQCESAYVTAIYNDPSPIGRSASAALALKFPATVAFNVLEAQAGGHITVTVQDADLNSDAATAQSTQVTLSCILASRISADTTAFQQTTIDLTETALSSSLFTAAVELCESCASSGAALNIGSQSTGVNRLLNASYTDSSHVMEKCLQTCHEQENGAECSTTCTTETAKRTAQASVSTLGSLEVAPFFARAHVVTVTLHDLNADTVDLVETINISVVSLVNGSAVSCGGECRQTLALSETGVSTGVFTASIATQQLFPGCQVYQISVLASVSRNLSPKPLRLTKQLCLISPHP